MQLNSHYQPFVILDADYSSGPYNVTIPAGYISSTFDITIIDNSVFEGNKEFYLIINQSAFNAVMIGNQNRATVEILDNECK